MKDRINYAPGENDDKNDVEAQAMIREFTNPLRGFLRFGRAFQKRMHHELQNPFPTLRGLVCSRVMLIIAAGFLATGITIAGLQKIAEHFETIEEKKAQEEFRQKLEEWMKKLREEEKRLENPPPSPPAPPSQNDSLPKLG